MADEQDQDLFGENKASTSPEETEDKLFGEDNTTEISLDDDKKEEASPLPQSTPIETSKPDTPPSSSAPVLDEPTTPSSIDPPVKSKTEVPSLCFPCDTS